MSDEREHVEPDHRALSFAELAAQARAELEDGQAESWPSAAKPGPRDDELLDDLPPSDHHLGRFAGWRAGQQVRLIVGVSLTLAFVVGATVFVLHTRQLRERERHPLPEVEATITPGTPREMTLSEGNMRVALSREPPAINLLHLPDRDITLARGADKAQFKVEIRSGQTVRIKVLTGEIVETLTQGDAQPLLEPR